MLHHKMPIPFDTILSVGGGGIINTVTLPDDLTAAVALRITSRRLTEREPKALVITLIDSSPKLLLLLFPSSMQDKIYKYLYI
jgi:hypothetical protein